MISKRRVQIPDVPMIHVFRSLSRFKVREEQSGHEKHRNSYVPIDLHIAVLLRSRYVENYRSSVMCHRN